MALSYSLKYQKQNFFHKLLLEKEGEIILDRQGFRLRGKGAHDQGETIHFAEMKELAVKNDRLTFTTFKRERFTLSNFLNMFEPFVRDFFRVRNEFLADALLMKAGMLYQEYEGHVEVTNRSGVLFNKGKCRLQFYEGSIVFMPETEDAFAVFFNFLKHHEFDEDEYTLKLHADTGSTVKISQLGTNFEDLQETLETLLGKMYERIINNVREFFPDLDPGSLLKFSYLLRDGKCVQISPLKKIHPDLPRKAEELMISLMRPQAVEKFSWLKAHYPDHLLHVAFSFFTKAESRDVQMKAALIFAVPKENIIICMLPNHAFDQHCYIFRIVMENGDIEERLQDKLIEISQFLYLFRFETTLLVKGIAEMRKTKYYTAFRRLSFFRLLKKSLLGRITVTSDPNQFRHQCEKIIQLAKLKIKTIPIS